MFWCLVDALAREKNVSREIVFQALESALASATKKRIHDDSDVRVTIDRESGDHEAFRRWAVLLDAEVTNDEAEIGLIDAREQFPDIQVGEYVEEPLEPIDFGRIGAQAAKQVILQKIRDAEREQILNDFLERKEFLVTGNIKRIERGKRNRRSGAGWKPCCPRIRWFRRKTCASATVSGPICCASIAVRAVPSWCCRARLRNS